MYLHQMFDKRKLLLVMLICVLLHYNVNAQDKGNKRDEKYFWFNPGLGFGLRGNTNTLGGTFGGNISYQFGANLISIRSVYNDEMLPLFAHPHENFWDVGILYGRNIKTENKFTSIEIGIGVTSGVKRGRKLYQYFLSAWYERLYYITIGIPIECQLLWMPTSFWGMSITGFANLNRKNSFGGILFSIPFGKLR